ncbi:MAG TPA: hypothetical protein VIP11_09645 [Gemmatimonadaceae bacterium]
MSNDRESQHSELLDRWLARGAMVVVVTLQFSLINDFGLGSRRLAPILELALLVPLTALMLRAEWVARRARTREHWESATWYRRFNRVLGIAIVTIISVSNARALFLLVQALLAGATSNGRALLLDSLNIWATNIIVFSLWYWDLDRGGPSLDRLPHEGPSEFVFPQMVQPNGANTGDARPSFIDYLFLSFNTSTAFSPTDTMPLTARMKLLMMLQSTVSLLTIVLVAARAVNILA